MKKFSVTLSILLVATILMAQVSVPNAFNYQAVVRNAESEIIANQDVTFRFSILKDSDSGESVYVEEQSVVTNDFGLVNLTIGTGTVISGGLDPGGWNLSEHFLQVEIDPSGGNSFTLLGTSKLQSVPYAFHAQTVAEDMVEDADADPENELQELFMSNDTIYLTPDGGHVKLPSSGVGGDNWGIQTAKTDATLEGDGTSSSPLKIAQQEATAGQALLWSGSTWLPGNVSDGETILWQQNGSDIFYNSGNVGIGLNNPSGMLEINGNGVDSYPHLFLSETDGFARISFRTMTAASKHWVLAGLTNQSDAVSQWHINYNNGSTGQNVFSAYGDNRIGFYGKVGIGTQNPQYKLDISGNVNINTGGSDNKALYIDQTEALWYNGTYFSWGYGADHNYFEKPIGIKTNALSNYELVVNGEAAKTGGGEWSNPSDIRLKDLLGNYTRGLNDIIRLQPIRFKYKADNPRNLPSDEEQIGFVAQEAQKVFPEAVNQGTDGYLDFNMHSVNVALVNAVKELKVENDRLNSEMVQMKTNYESRLSALEKLIAGFAEKYE